MSLKGFLEGLSREKYLVYFLLAWAGVFFFYGISGIIYRVTSFDAPVLDSVGIISRLLDIGAAVMLGLLSARMLNINLVPTLKKEALVAYFLLLWAGGFLFGAIYDFAWYAQFGFGGIADVIDLLGTLSSLAAAGVLALFAWKLLQSSSSLAERLQQPISQTI
jgi:hypothetical protein